MNRGNLEVLTQTRRYGIDPTWAKDVSRSPKIWEHNGTQSEEINQDIDLSRLGEITPRFITHPVKVAALVNQLSVVDLAFKEEVFGLTLTTFLHEAALEQFRSEEMRFVERLRQRIHDPLIGEEAWIFPMSALVPIEMSV